MARRFGSAMISKDSTFFIYSTEHMRVKVYKGKKVSEQLPITRSRTIRVINDCGVSRE